MRKPGIQIWEPDTCECRIYEYWDENNTRSFVSEEEANNLHQQIFDRFPESTKNPNKSDSKQPPVKVCLAHQLLINHLERSQAVQDENTRKNKVLRVLLGYEGENFGLEEMKKNQDGTDAGLGLKQGVEYVWNFEGEGLNRLLKVEVKGSSLSKAEKDAIKALCDEKLGSGKVEIV